MVAVIEEVRIVVVAKGWERYVFLFTDSQSQRDEVRRIAGRFASDPDLSFTWYESALVSQQLRADAY